MQAKTLAHGPVRYEPATTPYRVVLCENPHKDEYVVWTELLNEDGETHSGYHNGNYFRNNEYDKAVEKWVERVQKAMTYNRTDTRKRTNA